MSIRENIQFFYPVDIGEYLNILKTEYEAQEHPAQPGAFIIRGIPFYKPRKGEDYISILGFNYAPLSGVLLRALIDHPELAPEKTFVQWTAEQELVVEGTLIELNEKLSNTELIGRKLSFYILRNRT
jgi:hypothetical protein